MEGPDKLDLETFGARLRQAREDRGFKKASDAAKQFGWSQATYYSHEGGTRGATAKRVKLYADAFKVREIWLLTGHGDRERSVKTIRVAGYVGAGGEIHAVAEDGWAGLDEIEAPPGAGQHSVAAVVRGDSALPVYEDGAVLVWSERRYDVDAFLNRPTPMIVYLVDGRTLLKRITRGNVARRYTLLSANASPIEDVEIESVSRVDWTQHRR